MSFNFNCKVVLKLAYIKSGKFYSCKLFNGYGEDIAFSFHDDVGDLRILPLRCFVIKLDSELII